MTKSENNHNSNQVEWKDPKKELPEADTRVLVAFRWSGCEEDYDIFFFDGKDWHDNYGCSFEVLGWMYIPQLPKECIINHNINQND